MDVSQAVFTSLRNNVRTIGVVLMLLIQIVQIMDAQEIKLPAVDIAAGKGFMATVADRRSVREFDAGRLLTNEVVGQLLWASVGVNRKDAPAAAPGKAPTDRCNPTALNCQEIDAYMFGSDGVWKYVPATHSLQRVAVGDHRALVAGNAAFSQEFVLDAPMSVVFVANTEKLPEGDRRLVLAAFDAGIACENLSLACAALGLATVPRATMDAEGIQALLGLKKTQMPMLNNPVGYAR